jgi:hypothetical protein
VPTSVLLVLIVLVGAYVVLAGIASLGFVLARRANPPPAPPEWPPVSVVVPAATESASETVQQIEACDYPANRLELLVPPGGPIQHSPRGRDGAETVRRVSVPEQSPDSASPSAADGNLSETVEGAVVLSMPTAGTISSGWIRSMVRRCTPETPVVVGPTIIEHEGLFLPRLQALSHLGRLAGTAGASHFGVPTLLETSNRAIHVDAVANGESDASPHQSLGADPPAFNPEADAVVARSAVNSFESFLERLAQELRRTAQSHSWLTWVQGVGLWLVHSVLFACALVAIAVPAWRQPTLLALVAKMGADVILTLPAAKHYGQRGLFRSLVPTELMLVLALPVAGLWAVLLPSSQDLEPKPE